MSTAIKSGRVVTVIYQSRDYRVVRVLFDDGGAAPAVVAGDFRAQNVEVGTWVSFEGKQVNHKTYGRQWEVLRSPVPVSKWTTDKVISALAGNGGVGPALRARLQSFAERKGQPLDVVLNSGDLKGSGIEGLDASFVLSRWRALRTFDEAARFLSEAGIEPKVLSRVWRSLGEELEEKITSDPWVLVRVAGVSFKEADEVALRLGVSLDHPSRIGGAVLMALQNVTREGHCYARTGQVVDAVQQMIPSGATSVVIAEAIKRLCDDEQIVITRDPNTGAPALYLPWFHEMETECVERLLQRSGEAVSPLTEDVVHQELAKWATGRRVSLTETQRTGIVRALVEPVSVLTGLPGTGKTTSLQAAVSVLQDAEIPFLLVAPTGIAAKRLSSVTGSEAFTVHKAFEAKAESRDSGSDYSYVGIDGQEKTSDSPDTEDWKTGPNNPHHAEVVIVDESSMLDLHMLYRLLRGTQPTCRLVFVGDPYQLPSVGAGDVLRDLVSCGSFHHTHLHEIFRQEETSGIVSAAHSVHAGETPYMDHPDFKLISVEDAGHAAGVIRTIARRLFEKKANFQVLSPRHGGDAGVTNLNEVLRYALNPPGPGRAERNVGGAVVREGDRIMVVRNDYVMGVYNGDVGKVSRIDHKAKTLAIRVFAGPGQPHHEVAYDLSKGPPPIRLAYAQTIHKSQGQEYDVIVVPMLKSFGRQLQRNLLYTAITRAKEKVIIVGEAGAVARASRTSKADHRNTLLSTLLGDGGSVPSSSGKGSETE